jgi:alginate O-acetyltransferase complex protein AlgI
MDTASIKFVCFGLLVAIISNFSHSRKWRSGVLFAATLVFLAFIAHSPLVFVPLCGFLLIGYAGLFTIRHGWPKANTVSVLAVIFVYIWLKKYTFLPDATFLRFSYLTLGLSYIFFRVLQLLIEASGDGPERNISFGAYLLYTLNFTTFVSGPIQRYSEFAQDQFAVDPIPLDASTLGLQVERLIRGFFKVNVLAMLLDKLREDALAQLALQLSPSLKALAAFQLVVVYPFFLYCNFSGYIDMVIALARLMRLRLPENFDRPFSASSFLDFWNRWHITLSMWLKTYVYNPLLLLLMRRVSSVTLQPFLGVFCFFVTFFLVGVWHGRTSEFMVFGLLQGGGVALNKLWQVELAQVFGRKRYKALARQFTYIALGRGLTFTWFAFTLFWFWGTWKDIDSTYRSLPRQEWLVVWVAVWLIMTVVLAVWEAARVRLLSIRTLGGPAFTSRYARVAYASAFALAILVITVLLNQPAPGIVYKTF